MQKLTLLSISFLMTACLAPKTTAEGTESEDENNSSGYTTIVDIQNGTIAEGETVTIQNAVVTTSISSDEEGFFIQDEGGGDYSGIYVFVGQAGGGIAPLVGDKLTITGSVSEFYDSTQLVVSSAESMTVTGETEPVATVLTEAPADWEVYEGCLVEFADQTVTSDINSYGEADLSIGIPMDDLFFHFETCYDAAYSSVTGVITYSFEEYKLNPRTQADLVGGAAGECEATVVTVSEVQSQDYENRLVSFENVVVTEAESDFGGNFAFWIQDDGGGEWSGLYIFVMSNTAAQIDVSRGDVVNLSGAISEYYDLTELTIDDISGFEKVSSGGNISATSLSSAPSDWENYESVLITLENVEVGADVGYGQYELVNYPGILIGDDLFDYNINPGDTIEALTGLVYYSFSEYKILPRDADDMTGQVDNGGGDPVVATIPELRAGTLPMGSVVTLEGVIVTNVGGNKIHVQDETATEAAGIVLYGTSSITANVGDKVNVTGDLTEYQGLLELDDIADFTVVGSGTINPVALSAAASDWETYESMLVTLNGVQVTSAADGNGNFDTDWSLLISKYMYPNLANSVSNGNSYSVTGFVNYYSGTYEIMPRGASDISAN